MLRNLKIDRVALLRIAQDSLSYDAYARAKAIELRDAAIMVFNTQQIRFNEFRTSETTPPKYVTAWEIKREGAVHYLINTDRSAMWVEFGAHAGGETPVLRYKPLTRALEIVSAHAS